VEKRLEMLVAFSRGMHEGKNGRELVEEYKEAIETVTPSEVMLIQHEQLKGGLSPKEMIPFVDKLMNVFHKPLEAYPWQRPGKETFIGLLMQENQGLREILDDFKGVIKAGDYNNKQPELLDFVESIEAYNEHLLKLENILFPMMEKKMERFKGLSILWALHDETREKIKRLRFEISKEDGDRSTLGNLLGNLYFKLFGLIEKQELILFPTAMEQLTREEHQSLYLQGFEYGFPYIEAPARPGDKETPGGFSFDGARGLFISETGHFDLEQLEGIFQHLPVDLTLVDENDKVAYFSKPKERIFPRSAAVIGRDVAMCHPPDSVHVVNRILESFKKGERETATFWIEMKGLFVYIQYHALRDKAGRYKGTLEITQEISGLKKLTGERRLLDWD